MLLNGRAPRFGEIMTFPTLAATFREVAEKGKDGFYKGRVAQAIVDLIQSQGGVMELSDLAKHESNFVEPIKYTYLNDVTVYEVRSMSIPRLSDPWLNFPCSALQMVKVSMPPAAGGICRLPPGSPTLAYRNNCAPGPGNN